MLRIIFAFLLSFLGGAVLYGQTNPSELVSWKVDYDMKSFSKGKTVTVTFTGNIKEGYHVYSAVQPSKSVLPLIVKLDKNIKHIQLLELKEEGKREVVYDDVFQADIASFGGQIIVKQQMKVKKKKFPVKGVVSYQVCNEEMCLPGNFNFEIQ
ncbi:MAG: hypothetical protein K1X92_10465 [Bacteroidia bacterium]|nr:hypothetical protein [Bacteroidia bacterium]